MAVIGVLQVLGGLALFLFGIRLLSAGMEKLAGSRIQEWLDRMTNRPLKGAFFGAAATALIQSSGLLMVTMIGLINANLMTLEQAVGVMMGQEIGTTLTGQMVAFKIGDVSLLFVVLGVVLIEFLPHRNGRTYGEIILGAGIVFVGMNTMSGALKVLAAQPAVAVWLTTMGRTPVAGVLAGTVATAVVQSSSAITALLVAMGMSGVIELRGAIALLLGANIGSCVMGLIASARLSRPARRASMAQILINVIGVVLFLPIIGPFTALVSRTSPALPRQIANAHTIFNVTVSIVLFPFIRQIARAAGWLIPQSKREEKARLTAYIDERQYRLPSVALTEAMRELYRMGEVTAHMLERSRQALVEEDIEAAAWVVKQEEELVDPTRKILEGFVNTLMQEDLSASQQRRCFQIKNLIIDVERVGDLAEDLAEAAQRKTAQRVTFSPQALQDLDRLCQHAHSTYTCALQSVRDGDRVLAQQACDLEDEFDALYLEARQRHIQRLGAGMCKPEADVLFVESLRNLERVSDHADNLGVSVSRN
ncbi:MAG TPA: Na/Pi cotransporter family protein [Anaerolineae bacterium]|nr:Na/Pi cotransporter family protein [Anaerolineae bacterium]